MKAKQPKPLTEAELYDEIRGMFPDREYAVVPQATQGTGFSARNWIDAVVMSLWPSRGLWIHGFEIKRFRSDWLRELKQPEKADSLFRHLDFYSIVAANDSVVTDLDELPKTWGLLVWNGERLEERKKAKALHRGRLDRKIDRGFFAALCRRIDQQHFAGRAEKQGKEEYRRGLKDGRASLRRELDGEAQSAEIVAAFKRASGHSLYDVEAAERTGAIVRLVSDMGDPRYKHGTAYQIHELGKRLVKIAAELKTIIDPDEQ